MGKIPYRKNGPCGDCPYRKDVDPGQFEARRFDALKRTSEQPAAVTSWNDVFGQTMFGCHQSHEGREQACAGWLAVAGGENLRVRMGVARGNLPREALRPGEDWPPLFSSYEEMAARQGREDDGRGEIKPDKPKRRR